MLFLVLLDRGKHRCSNGFSTIIASHPKISGMQASRAKIPKIACSCHLLSLYKKLEATITKGVESLMNSTTMLTGNMLTITLSAANSPSIEAVPAIIAGLWVMYLIHSFIETF